MSIELAGAHASGRQGTGIPGALAALDLDLDSLELRLARRCAAFRGTELWLRGQAGRLRLGYSPSALRLEFAAGEPLTVDLPAITEWCGGGGLQLRHAIGSALALGLDLDLRYFALDSARRVGEELVLGRDRHRDLRLGLRLHWFPGRPFATRPLHASKESPA